MAIESKPTSYTEKLMAMGYAFVCAHCIKLHKSMRSGMHGCGAMLNGKDCGGPIVGMVFPEYKGPLTRDTIANRCFRCGELSENLIDVKNKGCVGACNKHVGMVRSMKPVTVTEKKSA